MRHTDMSHNVTYRHKRVECKCIEENGKYTILTNCGHYHVSEIGCDAQLVQMSFISTQLTADHQRQFRLH